MKTSLLVQAPNSQLVIIDMQEKLASVMPSEAMQQVIKNANVLLQTAKILEIPTIFTEQYPKGLGKTCSQLSSESIQVVEKTAFSCCDEPTFNRRLTSDKSQIVLAGMETHICILQTAMALHAQGRHQVFVAEDAVISRDPANKANALERLRNTGVIVSNTESIVFEWLGKAEGDAFKQISKLIR
ncbi:MAG: isochorismatase family protein [Methylophilaceae bacterium]|nr:isochorismatase family protein [Methylophilaceae bacterium]